MMTDNALSLKVAARPNDSPDMAIQYVALNKNISITGKDKRGKYTIRREILSALKGNQGKRFFSEKVLRCKKLDEQYKNGNIIQVHDILSGKHEFSEKSVATIGELVDAKC